ncbi:MAG: DUF2059 domain-containing protein [Fibrobacteres bacterium]|nr:DUF2059 domain-containing protein [Fibrobacterota bacterium]
MKFHPFLLVGLLALSCHAAPVSAEDALIRKVIVRTGIVENVRTQMRRQMEATRGAHPELPLQTWKKVELEIQSTQMEDEMVQVWQKSFTVAELTEIDKFMSTATGKKFFQTSQVLVSRTAAVAALTGVRILRSAPKRASRQISAGPQVGRPGPKSVRKHEARRVCRGSFAMMFGIAAALMTLAGTWNGGLTRAEVDVSSGQEFVQVDASGGVDVLAAARTATRGNPDTAKARVAKFPLDIGEALIDGPVFFQRTGIMVGGKLFTLSKTTLGWRQWNANFDGTGKVNSVTL